MENLQGSETFNQCMDRLSGKWQMVALLGVAGILGGLAGFAGGMAGMATFCAQHT